MEDFYSILGVSKTASADEIKQAYRKLASRHHPDHGGDTEKFQQIQNAYSILSDPNKKTQYDQPNPFGKFFADSFDFSQFDFFRNHVRSQITRISVWLDLADVYICAKKIVTLNIDSHYHNLEVAIPPGLQDGQAIRYQNLGPRREDIIISFRIKPHHIFSKNQDNLCVTQDCSIWTMICGGELTVSDPQGHSVIVNVPPRTQPNAKLRLKNRGFPMANGSRGDMIVQLHATIPNQISSTLHNAICQEIQGQNS